MPQRCAGRGKEKTVAVMGTEIGDDEQSAPVKERRGSRERPRRSKSGGRDGERKRETGS